MLCSNSQAESQKSLPGWYEVLTSHQHLSEARRRPNRYQGGLPGRYLGTGGCRRVAAIGQLGRTDWQSWVNSNPHGSEGVQYVGHSRSEHAESPHLAAS